MTIVLDLLSRLGGLGTPASTPCRAWSCTIHWAGFR